MKNQSVLIAKKLFPQNKENRQSAKMNSRKNFVPHSRTKYLYLGLLPVRNFSPSCHFWPDKMLKITWNNMISLTNKNITLKKILASLKCNGVKSFFLVSYLSVWSKWPAPKSLPWQMVILSVDQPLFWALQKFWISVTALQTAVELS